MAASTKQIEANRRNAAGPHQMTEAGMQSIRTNAIRHGLACKTHIVLPGEDQVFFNELLASLQKDYAPSSTQEEMLVHQIAEHYWRLIRARNMEGGHIKSGLRSLADEFGINEAEPDDLLRGNYMATAMAKYEGIFSKISRYETAAERSYYRAIRELQKIQASARKASLQPAAAIQPDPEPQPEIRSVSQNEQSTAPASKEIRSVSQREAPRSGKKGEAACDPAKSDYTNREIRSVSQNEDGVSPKLRDNR